jgi:Flp pilus assembly protein TadD
MKAFLWRITTLVVIVTFTTITPILTRIIPVAEAQIDERNLKIGQPGEQQPPQLGRYYALVIGNNEYVYLDDLKTAVHDADFVANTLRDTYGFEVNLLRNATRDQILKAINDYRRSLDDTVNLLIYYAGHGHYDRDVDKAYWLPIDAQQDNNVKWISADDVTTNIKGIQARHVLIISDSCYSGMLPREADTRLTPSERNRFLQKMAQGKSRILISSGGNEPVADDGSEGHSVFANALLRGLAQIEVNVFTAEELFHRFIREPVAGKSDQTPQYSLIRNSGHEDGDFVFLRKKKIIESKPIPLLSPLEQYLQNGDGFANANRWVEAEIEYRKALKLEPDNAVCHTKIGRALERRGKWLEAGDEFRFVSNWNKWDEIEAYYRRALQLEPGVAFRHAELGFALMQLKKWKEAEAEYREALKLESSNAYYHWSLAQALGKQEKYVETESESREAVRLQPQNAWFHYTLGLILYRQKKWKEAESEYKQAIQLSPNIQHFHNNLGVTLATQGKLIEAEAEYRRAIEIEPEIHLFHGNLGNILSRQGKYAEAELAYKESIRLTSDDPNYQEQLKKYQESLKEIQSKKNK